MTRIIRFLSFLLVTILLGATALSAQEVVRAVAPATADEEPVGPLTEMTFAETSYDFGTVQEGTIVSHTFTFTNTGDEPLVLMDAKGSCGCTVPRWPREPVQPGETASLTVEFNTNNKRGRRHQKVTLTANTAAPQTFIFLIGEVEPRPEGEDIVIDMPELTKEKKAKADCFIIYPNPTAERLVLDIEAQNLGQRATVVIRSYLGQLMAQREVAELAGPVEFGVAHYPAGNYTATVQIGEQLPETRCFVVAK